MHSLRVSEKEKQLPLKYGSILLQRPSILASDLPDSSETLQVICIAAGKRCTFLLDSSMVIKPMVRCPYLLLNTTRFLHFCAAEEMGAINACSVKTSSHWEHTMMAGGMCHQPQIFGRHPGCHRQGQDEAADSAHATRSSASHLAAAPAGAAPALPSHWHADWPHVRLWATGPPVAEPAQGRSKPDDRPKLAPPLQPGKSVHAATGMLAAAMHNSAQHVHLWPSPHPVQPAISRHPNLCAHRHHLPYNEHFRQKMYGSAVWASSMQLR